MSESYITFINFDNVAKGYWRSSNGNIVRISEMGIKYLKNTLKYVNQCFKHNRHLYGSSTFGITYAKQKIMIDEAYLNAEHSLKTKRNELLTELRRRHK